MSIGLSTYSFFWRHSDRVSVPLDLPGMFAATVALGVGTFQICDYPAIGAMSDSDVAELGALAASLGLALELGVRGIRADALARHLRTAGLLGATMVRSMLYAPDDRPSIAEARGELAAALPSFEAAGVTLALETYEQVRTADLVDLVGSVASPNLGVCLDVANVVARLEDQRAVIDRVAPWVKNLHVKDFQFARAEGLVGFELTGAPLGDGLLEFDHLLAAVRPFERGMSEIIEHWLPWQGSEEATISREDEWTRHAIAVLTRIEEAHKSTG